VKPIIDNTAPALAIVIPAYKINYLDRTLLSIASQTCKEFTLYIGNDASPNDPEEIIDRYKDRINIIYKRYSENLGNQNLVGHWERCIDLVGNESWIWLFSDDDLMESTCVEDFFRARDENPDFDLFHFNVLNIDENGNKIGKFSQYPKVLSVEEFLRHRLRGGFNSYVVDFIFRKSSFYEKGRFENFDLAWCSDDATWTKLGDIKGIRTIERSKIFWRRSPYNITPDLNPGVLERKFNAEISFADWLIKHTQKNGILTDYFMLNKLLDDWFFRSIKSKINLLSADQVKSYISKYYLVTTKRNYSVQKILLFYYKSLIYSFITDKLKRLFNLKFL
jgi:glycosyltransferase involved in cell wall biosynthesis